MYGEKGGGEEWSVDAAAARDEIVHLLQKHDSPLLLLLPLR